MKKAIIVEFNFMTRIVIDENEENIENIIKLAKPNIQDKLDNDEMGDNLSEWYDDEEIPYSEDDETETKYVLSEDSINGIKINEKIFDEELFEYRIIDREDFIEDLIRWMSEAMGNDRNLMQKDLIELLGVGDDYIFSSISTNEYIYKGCRRFNETCTELLELNKTILEQKL